MKMELLLKIREFFLTAKNKHSELRIYLFGSFSRAEKLFNDIDLLIIYDDYHLPVKMRNDLEKINLGAPLHLIFMTDEEVQETNFLIAQSCIDLFQPDLNLD